MAVSGLIRNCDMGNLQADGHAERNTKTLFYTRTSSASRRCRPPRWHCSICIPFAATSSRSYSTCSLIPRRRARASSPPGTLSSLSCLHTSGLRTPRNGSRGPRRCSRIFAIPSPRRRNDRYRLCLRCAARDRIVCGAYRCICWVDSGSYPQGSFHGPSYRWIELDAARGVYSLLLRLPAFRCLPVSFPVRSGSLSAAGM